MQTCLEGHRNNAAFEEYLSKALIRLKGASFTAVPTGI